MAKKRKRGTANAGADEETHSTNSATALQPTVPGVHLFQRQGDLPWDLQKYWRQRYDIFSWYDEGIWMTEDAWFSVTHESVANKIAEHVCATIPDKRSIIVDAFAGVGGNAIAFALTRKFKRVYAIEKNPAALACARHNAAIYGVEGQISFFEGDCFKILGVDDEDNDASTVAPLRAVVKDYGVIFASPPWGGPSYKSAGVFDLEHMEPYSLDYIHSRFSQITKNSVLYLPRTSDLQQVARCVKDGEKVQVVHYYMYGMGRALGVYFGDWSQLEVPQ